MRALALAVLTGVSVSVAAPAALAEAVTTRIETRPFYGATVTLEEGVRVFRPLPRHDRVIINPGGQTPLSLSYSESRNYSFNEYRGRRAFRRQLRAGLLRRGGQCPAARVTAATATGLASSPALSTGRTDCRASLFVAGIAAS